MTVEAVAAGVSGILTVEGGEPEDAAADRLAEVLAPLPEGERLALHLSGEDACARGAALVARAGLLAEHALLVTGAAGDWLHLVARKCGGLPQLRALRPEESEQVIAVARRCIFLPKRSWKAGHVEMIRDGLERSLWKPVGIIDAGRLVGYLDYRYLPAGGMEMGFSMTDPDHRQQGHQKRLVAHLTLAHLHTSCRISSSEGNITLRVLKALGYDIYERRPGERLDGSTSVYLERPARRPFSLNWDRQMTQGKVWV